MQEETAYCESAEGPSTTQEPSTATKASAVSTTTEKDQEPSATEESPKVKATKSTKKAAEKTTTEAPKAPTSKATEATTENITEAASKSSAAEAASKASATPATEAVSDVSEATNATNPGKENSPTTEPPLVPGTTSKTEDAPAASTPSETDAPSTPSTEEKSEESTIPIKKHPKDIDTRLYGAKRLEMASDGTLKLQKDETKDDIVVEDRVEKTTASEPAEWEESPPNGPPSPPPKALSPRKPKPGVLDTTKKLAIKELPPLEDRPQPTPSQEPSNGSGGEDGYFSQWGNWTECTQPGERRIRRRKCLDLRRCRGALMQVGYCPRDIGTTQAPESESTDSPVGPVRRPLPVAREEGSSAGSPPSILPQQLSQKELKPLLAGARAFDEIWSPWTGVCQACNTWLMAGRCACHISCSSLRPAGLGVTFRTRCWSHCCRRTLSENITLRTATATPPTSSAYSRSRWSSLIAQGYPWDSTTTWTYTLLISRRSSGAVEAPRFRSRSDGCSRSLVQCLTSEFGTGVGLAPPLPCILRFSFASVLAGGIFGLLQYPWDRSCQRTIGASASERVELPPIRAGQIALALYSGLWAYNGWNYLSFITEELINPTRNLPLAIFISCGMCTLVYCLANLAFYAGTSVDELLESNAIAVTFADKYYGPLAFIMPILVAGSCFDTVNGVMLTSSRLFFVAGRNQHMPSVLSYINPYWKTPIPAVLFTMTLSLAYLLLSDNIYTLINYVQIVNWLAIGIATAGLLWLRVKQPPSTHSRPLQVNLAFPIIFLLGCAFLVIFPVIQAPLDTAIGIMLTGVPAYFIFVQLQGKIPGLGRVMDESAVFAQKLLLVVPTGEKKSS